LPDNQIVPIDMILPNKIPIIPLNGKPIFPGIFTPLMLGSQDDIQTVDDSMQTDGMVGLVLVRDDTEKPKASDLHEVGTVAKIVKRINLPDGSVNIFISTLKRFKIKKALSKEQPIMAAVEYIDDQGEGPDEIKALTRALLSEMKQVSENNPLFSEEMRLNMINIDHPGKIADFIASILNIDKDEQQKILELFDIRERMERVLMSIKREQELLKIQKRIQSEINEKVEKSQRDYFLREELKAIKTELGMPADAKGSDHQRFKEKLESFGFSGEVKELVDQELEKFGLMDPNSSEFIVTRNWLELVSNLPWKAETSNEFDMKAARGILENDHYGLKDVKDRIIEYLAVRKLKRDAKGTILCLVGPPGVGKTSVGRSIARALGKEFFRFSVGGMRDEAEIKGHRRTYVGALPGKIIQGLKITKSRDPVFMIDEIDKMGSSYQGDPSSALLEVLDPEQNFSFRDHYLDLPFDVSGVFFIVTANTLDTIPGPLRDRMEIIQLSGYVDSEKLEIAKRYLIPKSLERAGLKKARVKYTRDALTAIAEGYAREAGVRNFEKFLDRIHRKIALQVVTAMDDGEEGFKLTGQMGAVMQESAGIAYTWVRHHAAEAFEISAKYFEERQIHLHIPEGATPKDGPSAGVTMATALMSLVLGKQVKDRLAMTGELSLTGQVLPIGGLREKTVAAKRNKIRDIIIPKANEKDLDDIPDHVKKGITFHPVERMEEVLEIALH